MVSRSVFVVTSPITRLFAKRHVSNRLPFHAPPFACAAEIGPVALWEEYLSVRQLSLPQFRYGIFFDGPAYSVGRWWMEKSSLQ